MLAGQKERKNTLALTYVKTLKTIFFCKQLFKQSPLHMLVSFFYLIMHLQRKEATIQNILVKYYKHNIHCFEEQIIKPTCRHEQQSHTPPFMRINLFLSSVK